MDKTIHEFMEFILESLHQFIPHHIYHNFNHNYLANMIHSIINHIHNRIPCLTMNHPSYLPSLETVIPNIEKYFIDVIEFALGPKKVIVHVILIGILQASGMGIALLRDMVKYYYSFLSSKGKRNLELLNKMTLAKSYEEWKGLAIELDANIGADKYRARDESSLYDCKVISKRIKDTQEMMKHGSVFDLMFRLRGGLARDQFGMQNEGLFRKALAGTKNLVEKYHATVVAALDYICDANPSNDEIPLEAKLAFFNETRHSYGRTALLLSGGAYLGYYHVGVIKTLFLEGLIPRVISGASAGSLMAAALGTRTDDEIPQIYSTDEKSPFRHDFFKFITEIQDPFGRQISRFLPGPLRWLLHPLLSVIFDKKLINIDSEHFIKVVQSNSGPYTFQEAFDRTGRIINITVAALNPYDPPRLLNYLTAPHVCVWSAAVASCAIPGVFDSASLVVKEPNGRFRPEHEWMSQGHLEDDVATHAYSDGSIENDLPMQQLSELFNVNHFIISQVNFHSALLSSLSMRGAHQDSIFSSAFMYALVGYVRFLKAQIKDWVKNLIRFITVYITNPPYFFKPLKVVTQDYEGRENDITIMPWAGHISMLTAGMSVIKNPTHEEYLDVVRASEANTFPFIPRIKAHCQVEMTLDKCVQRLRRRIASGASDLVSDAQSHASSHHGQQMRGRGRRMGGSDRTPSFYTSRSILNLSGLSVSDPTPMTQSARRNSGSIPSNSASPNVSTTNLSNLAGRASPKSVEIMESSTAQGNSSSTPRGGMKKLFGSFGDVTQVVSQDQPPASNMTNADLNFVPAVAEAGSSRRRRSISFDSTASKKSLGSQQEFEIQDCVFYESDSSDDEPIKGETEGSIPAEVMEFASQLNHPASTGITKSTNMASFYYRREDEFHQHLATEESLDEQFRACQSGRRNSAIKSSR